jgi:hypothetical protein
MPDLLDAIIFVSLILWLGAGVKIWAEFIQYIIEGDSK